MFLGIKVKVMILWFYYKVGLYKLLIGKEFVINMNIFFNN